MIDVRLYSSLTQITSFDGYLEQKSFANLDHELIRIVLEET